MKTSLVPEAFTEETLAHLRTHPLGFQAQVCDARVRQIEAQNRRNFVEIGLIILHVEESELWKEMADDAGEVFHSCDAWMMSACPISRSHGYDAKSKIKILRENKIPFEEAAKIPRCNLAQLTQLSSSVMRDPQVLRNAATLSADEFNTSIRVNFPEQHFESRKPMRFYPTESARQRIDEALERAKAVEGAATREEALECVCWAYMELSEHAWVEKNRPISDVEGAPCD
jgi:hypothetical protein